MKHFHQQIRRAEQDGLFRATTADALFNFHFSNSISKYVQASPDRTARYDSLERVSQVDFFISHSCSCPSWMKRLALCHCLNLNLAIGSCGIAFLLAIVILVLPADSIRAVAQQDPALRYCLSLLWPFVVFLGTYLFGHLLYSRTFWTFWIDQVCVHPSDAEVKSRTLQAIPAFVAQSNQMLVIWDYTYWQRLWCNYEVAIAVKTSSAPEAICFVPVWMPLWVLSSFTLLTLVCFSTVGEVWSYQLDLDSRLSCIISLLHDEWSARECGLRRMLCFPLFLAVHAETAETRGDAKSDEALRCSKCWVHSGKWPHSHPGTNC